MVYSRGESLTTRTDQMKLFKVTIATAAALASFAGLTGLAYFPSHASNGLDQLAANCNVGDTKACFVVLDLTSGRDQANKSTPKRAPKACLIIRLAFKTKQSSTSLKPVRATRLTTAKECGLGNHLSNASTLQVVAPH